MSNTTRVRRTAAKTATTRIEEQRDEENRYANEFDHSEDAAYKSVPSRKRERGSKGPSKREKQLAADAFLATGILTADPIVTNEEDNEEFEVDFMRQVDINYDDLPLAVKRSVGREQCNKFLLARPEDPPETVRAIAECTKGSAKPPFHPKSLRVMVGGNQNELQNITAPKVLRNKIRATPFYGSETELDRIRAKLVPGGYEMIESLKREADSQCVVSSNGHRSGNGRKDNADGDLIIAFPLTTAGEKDDSCVLRIVDGMFAAKKTIRDGGVGGTGNFADGWTADPARPNVEVKVHRDMMYLEKHSAKRGKEALGQASQSARALLDEAALVKLLQGELRKAKEPPRAHYTVIRAHENDLKALEKAAGKKKSAPKKRAAGKK